MAWMNRYDIDEAVRIFDEDPKLGPAARFLKAYQETIDTVSDGWPYWRSGTKCADSLGDLLHGAKMIRLYHRDGAEPTDAQLKSAIKRIRSFMTRRSDVFNGQIIPDDPRPHIEYVPQVRWI